MVAPAICRVAIVDDDECTRETLLDEFGRIKAFPLEGPYVSTENLVAEVRRLGDAAICDHHLISNYAPCSGAELVAQLYQRQYPAVLRTNYGKADFEHIRLHRRCIPMLMPTEEFAPEAFFRAWEICRKEFANEFSPERRPWRTVIQVEERQRDSDSAFVILPGWNSRERIKLSMTIFPPELHQYVRDGERFFGQVNKGAECQEDLYFTDIEYSRA
jgi:hypothetical protein